MKSLLLMLPNDHPHSLVRRAFYQRMRTTLAGKTSEMLVLATWVGEHMRLILRVRSFEYSFIQLGGKLPSTRTLPYLPLWKGIPGKVQTGQWSKNTALISWSNQSLLRHLNRKLGQRGLLVSGAQIRTAMFLSHFYKTKSRPLVWHLTLCQYITFKKHILQVRRPLKRLGNLPKKLQLINDKNPNPGLALKTFQNVMPPF